MTANNIEHKQQQRKLLLIITTVTLILLLATVWVLQKPTPKISVDKSTVETIDFSTTMTTDTMRDVFDRRLKNSLNQQNDLIALQSTDTEQLRAHLQEQTNILAALQNDMAQLAQAQSITALPATNDLAADLQTEFLQDPAIIELSVNLSALPTDDKQSPKNINTYVPANTYVKGVILSGADASTGIFSRNDPSPILVRLIEQASLPNGQRVDLIDCRLSLAALGKISSSRTIARTERLSCVDDNGDILEVPVKAYLVGPDGKEGVRGNTVHRQMPVVRHAMLAGLGDVAAQSYTTATLSPFGATNSVSGENALAYSGARGVSQSADTIAQYLMKLADQYEPIVELPSGSIVEVVFLEGFNLNDSTPPDEDKDNTASQTDTFTLPDLPHFTFSPETLADAQALDLLNNLPDEAI